MSRLLFLVLLVFPLGSLADEVYRTTDAQGNVVYTDAPPPNATPTDRVEIGPTNTVQPPEILSHSVAEDTAETPSEAVSYSVTITEPANETSYPMGPGNFSVSASVSPGLSANESLQLFVDGMPWGDPQRTATWNLTNVFRGQHDLTVGVIDDSGKTLASSKPVRVFVHRPSVNFKNRS
jgi:hypothetical protein